MTSGSPSGMSNGARLVSAIAAVKNNKNAAIVNSAPPGNAAHDNRPQFAGLLPCRLTIAPGSSVPNARNIGISDRPIATSYDIICDEARRPPSSAHLLYDAQPAIVPP